MRRKLQKILRPAVETVSGMHERQPMLALAALTLAGIACGYRAGHWPLPAAGVCACCAAAVGFRRHFWRQAFVLPLFFCLGWFVSARDLDGRRLEARQADASLAREFRCRVGPEVKVSRRRGNAARHSFRAREFRSADGALRWRRMPVTVDWYGPRAARGKPVPRSGEEWTLWGKGRVREGRNGLPEMVVSTGEERSAKVADAHSGSWRARAAAARRQAAARLSIGIGDWGDVPTLIQAMLLGQRNDMPRATRRMFADSGTIHVFAISGLHIAFVAGLLTLLVRLTGVQRSYWVVIVAPMLIFYTVATGARPSAVRACIMAVLYLSAALFRRRPSALAALAGTALAVHLARPWLLFEVGNILSFVVMCGLVVFCGPFSKLARRACGLEKLDAAARLLEAAGEKRRARLARFKKGVLRFIADSFAVSLAAWISSVPLTAFYFGRFTPGGMIANLAVVPCASLIVAAGFLGLISSFVSSGLAACYNNAAGFFTVVMTRAAELTAKFPGGNFHVRKWEPWMVGLWFAGLAALALWLHTAGRDEGMSWFADGVEKETI